MNATPEQVGLSTKDIVQIVLWIITAIGVFVAAVKALVEIRYQREQREQEYARRASEYRWKQAQLAKTILDEIWGEEAAVHAMIMLDWSNRPFSIGPDTLSRITHEDLERALRTDDLVFDEKETFIRDCFDALLDGCQCLEHYININLLHFEDVKYPCTYYVAFDTHQRRPGSAQKN